MNGNADPLALTSGALRKFYATAARCGRNRIRTGTTKSSARATLTTCPTRSPSLQQLAAGGVARDRAEVIAKAIRDGVEQGDHVTSDQFKAGLAEVRTEIATVALFAGSVPAGTPSF